MTRQLKTHEIRRNEIIATAKNLFFQKGYDTSTIQDIIDTMGIAKGTFYHYFESKNELLDALVDQIIADMSERFKPLVNAQRSAVEKINDVFRIGAAYKVENIDAFIVILKTLYREENQILRDRMFQRSIEKNGPVIAEIVKQGINEGVFTTSFPEYMGEVMIDLGKSINESICATLLKGTTDAHTLSAHMIEKLEMYQEIIERILGAPKGSITMYEQGEFERIVTHFFDKLHAEDSYKSETKKHYMTW
jgi:AcrR family transcriptional regulator